MIYLDKPYVRVEWVEPGRFVELTWKGFVDGAEYREVLDRTLDVINAKRAYRMLSDLRKMRVLTPEDQDWVTSDWLPRSQASTLLYSALVLPQSALTQMTLNRVLKKAAPGLKKELQMEQFGTLEEARRWLMAAPDPKD